MKKSILVLSLFLIGCTKKPNYICKCTTTVKEYFIQQIFTDSTSDTEFGILCLFYPDKNGISIEERRFINYNCNEIDTPLHNIMIYPRTFKTTSVTLCNDKN